MSKTVSFSFATEEEKAEYEKYAKNKGMTLSAFVKMAVYHFKSKYPQTRKKVPPLNNGIGTINEAGIHEKSYSATDSTRSGIVGEDSAMYIPKEGAHDET